MINQIVASINSVTREIVFEHSNVSSAELDGGLWRIKFKMDTVFGQDPSSPFSTTSGYTISVDYSQNDPAYHDDGYSDPITDIVVDQNHDLVEFIWTPPLEASQYKGWLYFNIRVRNTSDGSTWSTKVKKIRVNPVVKGNSDSSLTPSQSDKISELLAETERLLAAIAAQTVTEPLEQILLASHPVGSYYWSDDETNPGILFGGTWEEVTDVFLFAAARDNQVGYQAGDNGGSKTSSHTLTVEEMPSHTHELGVTNSANTGGPGSKLVYKVNPETSSYYSLSDIIKSAGGGQAFTINTMPPYYATYCWRRTA